MTSPALESDGSVPAAEADSPAVSDPVTQLVQSLASGELSREAFIKAYDELQQQRPEHYVDLLRQQRCGFPEVVYGAGKSHSALQGIVTTLLTHQQPVLATRIDPEQAAALLKTFPQGRYRSEAGTFRIDLEPQGASPTATRIGRVAIITAGTTDLPVAAEVEETLDWMGVACHLVVDVGVAGPHRLPARLGQLRDCDVIVVVAGMEGALPSVVGGYADCPIIAVPTSVGYGASLGGVAALLSMLNSCAANVSVVNIDAGFKAGYLAGMITHRVHRAKSVATNP